MPFEGLSDASPALGHRAMTWVGVRVAGLAADSLGDLDLEVALICSVCEFQQPFWYMVPRSTFSKIQLHQGGSEFTQEEAWNMDPRKSAREKW